MVAAPPNYHTKIIGVGPEQKIKFFLGGAKF